MRLNVKLITDVYDDELITCGAIAFENDEFIVYIKNGCVTILFGAIANALFRGKELFRFGVNEIASYKLSERTLNYALRITLLSGSYVEMYIYTDKKDKLLSILQNAGIREAE